MSPRIRAFPRPQVAGCRLRPAQCGRRWAEGLNRCLFLCALMLALLAGCATRPAAARRLVYGLTLAPSGIDPHVNASSELGIPLTSVYDTLVYQEPATGRFVPGLAESWKISDDGRTYSFTLRRDVKFHDGTPFNAAAVKVNLERIANPATQSQKAVFMLGPIDRADVPDEFTVVIRLKQPFAPLLDSLSQVYLGIASPAALAKWGKDYQLHQVGTGPFIFKEYVPQDHLTLARNPDYRWGPAIWENRGPAHLDEITFRFFVDPATRALALESGQVQVMGEVPPQDVDRLTANKFVLHAAPIPGQPLQFFLNTRRAPTDDVRVRQALLYATDRAAIVKAIFRNRSPVAFGPLTSATVGYDPKVEKLYPFDPDKARQLLDDAGWRPGPDGVRHKDGQRLRVDGVLMDYGFVPETAQLVQAQWALVGVEWKTQSVPYGTLLQAGREGSVNVIPFLLSGSDPDILRQFFRGDGSFNYARVSDPALDAALDQAVTLTDPQARALLYADVQERVMVQALIVPIRDYVNLNVAAKSVTGLRYDARGWFPLLSNVSFTP
jgi:peptide/nickel transport system substrate-binding protein